MKVLKKWKRGIPLFHYRKRLFKLFSTPLFQSLERKLIKYLLKSNIDSPKVSNEKPTKSPRDPPMSPKREENGYKIDSFFLVTLMLEYPKRSPGLRVFSSALIIRSFVSFHYTRTSGALCLVPHFPSSVIEQLNMLVKPSKHQKPP